MRVSLRAARQNADMDVEQVSKAVGVTPSSYYKWEQGVREPSYKHMKKLSILFGKTVDALFFDFNLDDVSSKADKQAG